MKNISGHRIKGRRQELGLGQVDLAAALTVDFEIILDQSDVSEMERGIRGIKDIELDAIARILDVSPLWLMRGDEV